MDKAHILAEIKRTAAGNGGLPLGRGRFLSETGIKESDWIGKYWVRSNRSFEYTDCKSEVEAVLRSVGVIFRFVPPQPHGAAARRGNLKEVGRRLPAWTG